MFSEEQVIDPSGKHHKDDILWTEVIGVRYNKVAGVRYTPRSTLVYPKLGTTDSMGVGLFRQTLYPCSTIFGQSGREGVGDCCAKGHRIEGAESVDTAFEVVWKGAGVCDCC